MFYLSLIEHTLRLPPHLLNLPLDEAIKIELEALFLDKVIANLGLCISVYDIRSIKGGFIYPGDGASTYTVEFRLIVFRPFVGEIIVAKLKESDANGLRYIVTNAKCSQCHLDFLMTFTYLSIFCQGHLALNLTLIIEIKEDGYGTLEKQKKHSLKNHDLLLMGWIRFSESQIKFRVHSVIYPSIPLEQPENSKPFAPMVITGSIDYDGLGPVSWWEEAEMVQEES
ncbi:RNA polymerase Rpb7-like [Theobroma cacao]|nr:RNA polymerase Rpb7-like [Theobroma cacao]